MAQMRILAKLQVDSEAQEETSVLQNEMRKLKPQSEVSRLHKSESCKQISLLSQWHSFVYEICDITHHHVNCKIAWFARTLLK